MTDLREEGTTELRSAVPPSGHVVLQERKTPSTVWLRACTLLLFNDVAMQHRALWKIRRGAARAWASYLKRGVASHRQGADSGTPREAWLARDGILTVQKMAVGASENATLARPKSHILSLQSALASTFLGFKSLWKTFAAGQACGAREPATQKR